MQATAAATLMTVHVMQTHNNIIINYAVIDSSHTIRFENTPDNGYSDPPGVTVTAPGFGSISSIEFVGPYPFYYPLVEYLVQRGYTIYIGMSTFEELPMTGGLILVCQNCMQKQNQYRSNIMIYFKEIARLISSV